MGLFGLINILVVTLTLFRAANQNGERFRNSTFILLGLFLYGYQTYFSVRLMQTPSDGSALISLADFMVAIYIFGVIRAWELVGIRRFHVRDLFVSRNGSKKQEKSSSINPKDKAPEIKKKPG